MPNINCSPEAFGLTVVGTAYDDSLCYEFDEFIIWRDAGGGLRWASDSGGSCPEPFGDVTLDDTGHGTVAEAHAALREWASSTPGKQASAADLLLKLIMPAPVREARQPEGQEPEPLDRNARYTISASVPGVVFVAIGYETGEDEIEDRRFAWLHAEGEDTAEIYPVNEIRKIEN